MNMNSVCPHFLSVIKRLPALLAFLRLDALGVFIIDVSCEIPLTLECHLTVVTAKQSVGVKSLDMMIYISFTFKHLPALHTQMILYRLPTEVFNVTIPADLVLEAFPAGFTGHGGIVIVVVNLHHV